MQQGQGFITVSVEQLGDIRHDRSLTHTDQAAIERPWCRLTFRLRKIRMGLTAFGFIRSCLSSSWISYFGTGPEAASAGGTAQAGAVGKVTTNGCSIQAILTAIA